MANQSIKYDEKKSVTVEFKLLSPSILAYGVWLKRPGQQWNKDPDKKGTTEDEVADIHDLGIIPRGTELHISLGLGGKAKRGFKVEVDFLQDGASVGASGTFFSQGLLDNEGIEFTTLSGVFQ